MGYLLNSEYRMTNYELRSKENPEHGTMRSKHLPGFKAGSWMIVILLLLVVQPLLPQDSIYIVMEHEFLDSNNSIVTALERIRSEKSLGYSIQEVSGDIINQSKEPNIVNSLQGRVAGVQITNADGGVASGSRIIIRGVNCLNVNANNQPLFILDGVPVSNEYSQPGAYGGMDYGNAVIDLNPADIENISVLKGASAASLYGSRALNGAVLVTTKTGDSESLRGSKVTFESGWMWDRILVLPDYQDKYGQGVDGKYPGWWWPFPSPWPWASSVDESWGPPLDVGLMFQQWDSPYDPEADIREETPWISRPDNVKNFFETGHRFNRNLSIQGSTDNSHYRMSYSNLDVKGTIPHSDLKRNTLNFSAGYDITKRLNVGGMALYISNRSDNIVETGHNQGNPMHSLGQWFGRQVNVENLRKYADQIDPVTGYPMNWNYSYHDNPYWMLHNNTNSRNRDRIIGNINLNYHFADWLSFNAIIGNDWYIEDRKERIAHLTNGDRKGGFWAGSYRRNEMNANGALIFSRNNGNALSVTALLGGELNRYDYQYHSTSIKDFILPGNYSVANAAVAATTGLNEKHTELHGVFGSLNLGFRDFLFLDVTGRNDWSSTLPKKDRSCFYPSVSLAAVVTEALGIESGILSFAKLRAGYARVGGMADPYQVHGTFSDPEPFDGLPSFTHTDTRPLYILKPRIKESLEFGGDIKLFRNKLGMDITWYKENITNQIIQIPIARTSGFSKQNINTGELQNKGVEIILYANPVRSTHFSWDIIANWSANECLVVVLHEDVNYLKLYDGSWYAEVHARPGEEYGVLWGYGLVRENQEKIYYDEDKTQLSHVHYTGRPVVDTDGFYTRSKSKTDLGCVYPDWFGGVNNTFRFRNLTAGFLVDFRKGGVIYSVTDWFGHYAGVLEATAAINDNGVNIREPVADGGGIKVKGVYGYLDDNGDVRLTDADGNDVDSPVENTSYADAQDHNKDYWGKNELSVFDASFLKLREVSLGYTFRGVPLLKRAGISILNISLLGRNLWIIHKNTPDIDPEIGMGAGNYVGIETNAIPSVRSMGFNIKVSF